MMSRSIFRYLITCLAFGLCLSKFVKAAQDSSARNVVFIVIDDLNDWVEPLKGHPLAQTPFMAEMAAKGFSFENAHSNVPICNPSRVSMLTGLNSLSTGVLGNGQNFREYVPDVRTLSQDLQCEGYYTAAYGKILHGFDDLDEPWDEYESLKTWPEPEHLFPLHGNQELVDTMNPRYDWGPMDSSIHRWGDWQIARLSTEFLLRDHNTPFFLAVGLRAPHFPWYAPRHYFDMYPTDSSVLPPFQPTDLSDVPRHSDTWAHAEAFEIIKNTPGLWEEACAAYLANITFADDMVGWVLRTLENSRYRDNTIVVLVSDHGFHLGEKDRWSKETLWEESTRIPFLIQYAGMPEVGGRSSVPVDLLDVYPTIIDYCELEPRSGLHGKSLIDLIEGVPNGSDFVLSTRRNAHFTIRDERFRYIRNGTGEVELYDHFTDPNEWNNLYRDSSFAALIDSFGRRLDSIISAIPRVTDSIDNGPCCLPPWNLNSEIIRFDSIRLSWSPNQFTVGYQVFVQNLTDSTLEIYHTGESTELRVGVLDRNDSYRFAVKAICGVSFSDSSVYSDFHMFSLADQQCRSTDSVWVKPISPSSVRLRWNVPPEGIGFKIRRRLLTDSLWQFVTINIPRDHQLITSLNVGDRYEWQIRTICDSITLSPWFPPDTFTVVCDSCRIDGLPSSGSNLLISPIPVRQWLKVQWLEHESTLVYTEIVDINGRKVLSESAQNIEQIEVSGLSPGIYLLRVVDNRGETEVSRFTKW